MSIHLELFKQFYTEHVFWGSFGKMLPIEKNRCFSARSETLSALKVSIFMTFFSTDSELISA
jgi:hypothetical protein